MTVIEFVDERVGFDKAIVHSALTPAIAAAEVIALLIDAININDLIVALLLEILLKEG